VKSREIFFRCFRLLSYHKKGRQKSPAPIGPDRLFCFDLSRPPGRYSVHPANRQQYFMYRGLAAAL